MKKIYSIVTGILLTASVWSQAPQKMSYQAVIRNSSNALVTSTKVGMRISILKGSAAGTEVYVETQNPTTNANGLVSIEIGSGPAFSVIDWSKGSYFIKTETDPLGGTNYTIEGANELLSVPYALFAANSTPGPKGDKGETGAQGLKGDQGIQGIQGVAGIPGPKGDKGEIGAQGIQGIQGEIGLTGPKGDKGETGAFQAGTAPGQMNYWNGSAWVTVSPGSEGQALIFCGGEPTWTTGGICPGKIGSLDCATATNNGTLTQVTPASGVSSAISYTIGNGGSYSSQTITSTGVTGLTATLQAGSFANGNGTLSYTISGTPTSSGTASFAITIGGKNCTLIFNVIQNIQSGQYTAGTVHCSNTPTVIVPVTNPTTGKIWMDRNLGATQVATSSTDVASYGDLYQWGRGADGHQCRTSATTATLSTTDVPGNANFIIPSSGNYDWLSTQNDNLWQGVNGVNNPCPSGYRIPTLTELEVVRASSSPNPSGAFASPLKLPLAGSRNNNDGSLNSVSGYGRYWSSTINGTSSRYLDFGIGNADMSTSYRANGLSVRCIKE